MIYEFDYFCSKDECESYIKNINTTIINIPFTNSGKFINNKWNDERLSTIFYEKLQKYNIKNNKTILRPNKIIMSGKYTIGDSFSLHTDTGLYYDIESREKTQWTLLIYLNDNFNGGETIFYDNNWNITKVIIPKMGKAILFDINLWHKGNPIIEGEKYWIGCEIIGKF